MTQPTSTMYEERYNTHNHDINKNCKTQSNTIVRENFFVEYPARQLYLYVQHT